MIKKGPSQHISNKNIAHLKKNYDFGNGVEVTLASTDHKGNKNYSHYYTNKLPKLEISLANAKRTIEVEASSIETEDKKILYFLYKKTQ